MADVSQQQTAHRRVSPTTVDIDGTITDRNLSLPRAVSSVDQLRSRLSNEMKGEIAEVTRGLESLRDNRNLLTAASYDRWAGFVDRTNEAIEKAIQANKPEEVKALLDKLKAGLNRLDDFFKLEKAQGLIATHAETGVRIYLKDGQLYFVSPDKQAFDHQKNEDKIRDYVRLAQHHGAIDRTHYQDEGTTTRAINGGQTAKKIDLLGCRIDRVALYENPGQVYEVTTKLRSPGSSYTDHTIRFTLESAAAAGVGDAPNDAGAIRPLNALGQLPERNSAGIANEGQTPGQSLADIAVQARLPLAAENSPTRVLVRDERPQEPVQRRAPSEKALERQQKVAAELETERTRIRAVDPESLTEPKAVSEALNGLDEKRQAFQKLLREREKFLEAELKRVAPESNEHQGFKQALEDLKELRAEETIRTKALLEKQLASSDELLQKSAKVRLVLMADEIDGILTARHEAATDPAAKVALDTERTAFKTNVETWKTEVRGWPKQAIERVGAFFENNSWVKWMQETGKVDINPLSRYLDRRAAANATKALAECDPLCAKDFAAMDAKGKAGYFAELEAQEKVFGSRIKSLERQIAKGATGLDTELTQLRDAHSKVTLREAECLRQRIEELGPTGKGAQKLTARLYDDLAEAVDQAYGHLEKSGPLSDANRDAREAYQNQRESYELQQDVDATRRRLPGLDERNLAARQVRQAEQAVDSAPEASPRRTEAEAARDLAKSRQSIVDLEAQVSHLNDKLNLTPNDEAAKARLSTAEAELTRLRTLELEHIRTLRIAEFETVASQVSEIDEQLNRTGTDAPDAAKRSQLLSERAKLRAKAIDLELDTAAADARSKTATSAVKQTELAEQLKVARAELTAATDITQKSTLERQVATLEKRIAASNVAAVQTELHHLDRSRQILQVELTEISDELNGLTDPKSKEAVVLRSREKLLKTQVGGLDKLEKMLTEKRDILVVEHRARLAEEQLPRLQSELQELKTLEENGQALTQEQQARQTSIEERIARYSTYETEAVTARGGFVKRWDSTFREMRVNGARMIEQLRSTDWDIRNPKSPWHTKVEGPGRWMEANPMKSAMVAAGITEALHLTTINWDKDAIHTPVPAVVFLLQEPLETWGLNLDLAQFEFSTKEGGTAGTLAAETFSRTGNVAAGLGAFYLVQKAAKRSTFVARGLGMMGAPLAHVGSAYFGYVEFSSLEKWEKDSDLALGGRVTSPILGGALAGAAFGPPGSIAGAGAGALGEAIGVTRALVKLDYAEDKQWRQRGVRESIELGLEGYLLPKDHPDVIKPDASLTAVQEEVIDDFARDLTLRRIFGVAGEGSLDSSEL
ncbi:MAG: hypothetical protein KDD69_09795, partial [Bdellovibrionales bacterium]|nr:hypothetical protein [Bdellovibrionales bacterium]